MALPHVLLHLQSASLVEHREQSSLFTALPSSIRNLLQRKVGFGCFPDTACVSCMQCVSHSLLPLHICTLVLNSQLLSAWESSNVVSASSTHKLKHKRNPTTVHLAVGNMLMFQKCSMHYQYHL